MRQTQTQRERVPERECKREKEKSLCIPLPYLQSTVEEADKEIKLLVLQHGSVGVHVVTQLLSEGQASHAALQCSQHRWEYLHITERQVRSIISQIY